MTQQLWQPQPEAARLVRDLLTEFCRRCPAAERFGDQLRERTGTRLLDWIDHLARPYDGACERQLRQLEFVPAGEGGDFVWRHPQALLPRLVLHERPLWRAAVKVDSVADFLAAHRLSDTVTIEGAPDGQLRRAKVADDAASFGCDTEFWVVERHGYPAWEVPAPLPGQSEAVAHHMAAFRRRPRHVDPPTGFAHAGQLIASAGEALGVDWASDLFFAAEREYWTGRNHAAQWQLARQASLGLGWGNHDHHTYRSSRECFASLVSLLEQLGLVCRERFYAGREAGWGAQILEQPQAGIVVFADVDLAAEEVADDFAHQGLSPSEAVGTVGLWCQLHGEAFLEAGMHHLECCFDFEAARQQLQAAGIPVLAPFTDLPYLKQAFTAGELWDVPPARVEAARAAGHITAAHADRFRHEGSLGSHLEILQRDEGYKGFNQAGISDIIRRTDPRLSAGKNQGCSEVRGPSRGAR